MILPESKINQELSCAGALIPNDEICPRAKLDTGTFCNYKCYFCYYISKLDVKTEFNIIKERIDKLYELGCRDFDLSGGESSIHKDFIKIIEYIKNIDSNNKVSCLTNGFKFSDFKFTQISAKAGLSDILFSLHSVNDLHDEIVGKKGAFNKIVKAIENAKELNIRVRLNSTITNKNFHLIDNEYFDLVEKLEPSEMNFLPLNYFEESKTPRGIDYGEILEPIKKFIDKSSIKIINVRYVPFCYMQNYEKYVCGYYQHIFDLYDWNIAYYDFLKSTKENLANQAKINRINNYNKSNKCRNCKYFYICDGIEFQVNSEFKPILCEKSEMIKDVNYFRKNHFKEII